EPDTGIGNVAHKVTEALRAPLSVAASVTGNLVDAAVGGDSHGLQSKARKAGAGLAAALAVTTVVTRRKRRRCRKPAGGKVTPGGMTAPEALLQQPQATRGEPETPAPGPEWAPLKPEIAPRSPEPVQRAPEVASAFAEMP